MTKSLKHSFIVSLLIIGAIIAMTEGLVMLFLQALPQWHILLSPAQEAVLDTTLLSMLAAPSIWAWSLRPLARKIDDQQRHNERALQDNRQLLNTLNIHALVSITDTQGRIIHANRQFCEVSGYAEDELLGQDHRIVNSGQHDKAFFRNMWRTIARGQPWQGEVCNRNRQGHFYWVDTTIAPMLDDRGKPCQYISIRRDITKIKDNENRLLILKRALDACGEMIMITDDHGCIQYANPALCDFTGWKEAAILGRPPTLFDSPQADPAVLRHMQQNLRYAKAWSGRLLCRRHGAAPFNIAGQTPPPDPRDYWADVSVTAIRGHEGDLLGYVQIQRDITEQVNKEQAQLLENADTVARLAISETLQKTLPIRQRITEVLDILFDLKAFDLQRKGGVFLKNPQQDMLDMFVLHGAFSEEFIRREQHIPYGACLCGRAAISQQLIVSDDCFCDPRHEHVFEGMRAHGHYIVPIVSAGETLGIVFLYTDPYPVQLESRLAMLQQVGDMLALALLQEQAKTSLETARDVAEQAARVKAEFLANMSHEIRTPMNGVLGMLDILKDTELTPEQYDLLTTACHSAESLLIIINDILDFSKLEAGKLELEHIEFDLPSLVEEVCALMSPRAHDKGLELNCFLPPQLPPRWLGDPNRIRQILTNLISNAVKFTGHGEVSINVLAQDSLDNTSVVRFEVMDTGIGLSPEEQARLFQPFSQADSSTARRFGGTGLGLSISKNLVNIMQGSIGVESAVGNGACFWFNLPLQAVDSPDPVRVRDLSGKRALIVDDNATNRKILQHYLEHWGMHVSEADSAPQALALIENLPEGLDIILTDLHMPEMDGYALAFALNARPRMASIPRLLLSSGGVYGESMPVGPAFAQILLKPIRQEQLFDAIANALQLPAGKAPVIVRSLPGQPDFAGKRVLVVEDNPVNQKVILTLLAKCHCRADLSENGQEALARLAQQQYDLVLMDCQMPIMDGYEAVRILRGQELARQGVRTPVVALTAHAGSEEREKCLSAGMDDFLSKPISRSELAKILAYWLRLPDGPGTRQAIAAAQAESEVSAMIWDEDAALKRLDDDKELLGDMIALFLADNPGKVLDMETALAQQDLPALADAAHAIKGMAGHFCAEPLIRQAADLERCARQGETGEIERLVHAVKEAETNLTSALKRQQGIPP